MSLLNAYKEDFKRYTLVSEIMQHYKEIRENVDIEHNRIYCKALFLSTDIGSQEGMPRIIRGQQTSLKDQILMLLLHVIIGV